MHQNQDIFARKTNQIHSIQSKSLLTAPYQVTAVNQAGFFEKTPATAQLIELEWINKKSLTRKSLINNHNEFPGRLKQRHRGGLARRGVRACTRAGLDLLILTSVLGAR